MAVAAIKSLCYHRVGGALELGVTRVGRSVFGRQMTALAKAGWKALTLSAFENRLQRDVVPSCNEFLLTFDDGYASLAEHAYPVLADLGFTATTFLVTDYIGQANTWDVRYTWRRLRHLDWPAIERFQVRGFDFASHGARHRRLTWLDDDAVVDELGRSRETLTRRLGADAGRAVAYPFGAADPRVQRLAGAAGYELGFGSVQGDPANRLHVPRVPVYLWDLGLTPIGLRHDALGTLGRFVALVANRCAVGTTLLRALSGTRAPTAS